jgi:uncharacterized SAM-binding protein YcdF (DUF218 family)
MSYDTLPGSLVANGSRVSYRRRFGLWILVGMVFVLLASFGFAGKHLARPKLAQFQSEILEPAPAPAPPRIYLRAGDSSREGLGVSLLL